MDEQLAAIYGTGQPEAYDDDDLQKTAAAELLVKLAEEEGVDLDDFSDEEIAGMLGDLYQGGQPEGETVTDQPDEAEEKVAEADFLGRVMAHSMVQELNEIEKDAGIREWAGKGKELVGRYGSSVKRRAGEAREALRKYTPGAKKGEGQFFSGPKGSKVWGTKKTVMERVKGVGSAAKKMAPELAAGTAVAGGTGAALAMRGRGGKKKKAEADFDKIAEQRAYEMLAEAGYLEEEQGEQAKFAEAVEARAFEMLKEAGYPVEEQIEEDEQEKIAQAVEVRALQMLEEAGYPVEWNE